MRSLRNSAIITLMTNPENNYEDMFPKGNFYRILCENFLASYKTLQTAFGLIKAEIPINEISLRPDGTINLLNLMNKLKKSLLPSQFLILIIYTGGVNVDKRLIYFGYMTAEEQIEMFRMARKMACKGDYFLLSALEIIKYQKKLDAASEVTRAVVRRAVDLDSFVTLYDIMGSLVNKNRKSLLSLFSDLPCEPSKKIGQQIRRFLELKLQKV